MHTRRTIGLIVLACVVGGFAALVVLTAWLGGWLAIAVFAVLAVAYALAIGPWQRGWGATAEEVHRAMPGDGLLRADAPTTTRAITIDAPPEQVFPWLRQIGYGRGGWYSYDWIDNWGRTSPRELTPGLDDLEHGQRAVAIFHIAHFERDRSITLHAPRSIFGNVAISYVVTPVDDDRSRLTAKVIVRYPGVARVMRFVPPVGDWIMMRKQLRTLKALAERDRHRAVAAELRRIAGPTCEYPYGPSDDD